MAGSILIDDKSGVAFNSYGFDTVVGLTKNILENIYPELIEPIYRPIDEECMSFISLEQLDKVGISKFIIATKKAFLDWQKDNSASFPEWEELIEKLESDERFTAI